MKELEGQLGMIGIISTNVSTCKESFSLKREKTLTKLVYCIPLTEAEKSGRD